MSNRHSSTRKSSFVLCAVCVLAFTSCAGRLGNDALPSFCQRSAGLRGHKGRGGVQGRHLHQGRTSPRLRAFLKSTCLVLLRTGTPLAPLAQFAR